MKLAPIEPYRVLFLLGGALGIVGSGLWILFNFHVTQFYPKQAHANLMYFGLLWCFIAGFFMTAIPKMTRTQSTNTFELFAATLLGLLQALLNVQNLTEPSIYLFGLQQLFLIAFIGRRFLVHKQIPFVGFYFLPLAFGQSLLGLSLFALDPQQNQGLVTLLCGEALVLNLILGLGSRLIPVISRLPNALLPTDGKNKKTSPWLFVTLVFLNGGYLLTVFGFQNAGIIFRALATLIAAVSLLGLFRAPLTWSYIGAGLKLGLLALLFGQIMSLPIFKLGIAALHFMFLGGFTLITFLISTRVMLAHGGQSLDYEVSSRRIALVTCLIFLAAAFRLFSGLNPLSGWILISFCLLSFAVILWGAKFISILTKASS